MTALYAPTLQDDLRLRREALRESVGVIRALRRTGVDTAARSVTGRGDVPSGDLAFAQEVAPCRWILGLVDARGPGADAAATAVAIEDHIRSRSRAVRELPLLLASANDFLRCEAPGRLAAVSLIALDTARRTVRVALAGAVTPVVLGRDGDVAVLGRRGPALGLVDDVRWRDSAPVRLGPGHLLVAATDGVVECVRDDGSTFGLWRVAETMRELRDAPARSVVRSVLVRASAFGDESGSDRAALALRMV
ncbi:MAG: serine/threonine-protein phosphatase [Planctomycetes bacterium]|nr:serine/threonine-protein phosphatase [Planctomycetota bacterium]